MHPDTRPVAIVTGSNTGIGRATAEGLARRGFEVVLACRSREKTLPVVEALKTSTGNLHVDFLELDLGSLASVRKAAATFLESGRPLHVLVNNAGIAGHRGLSADGFELTFAVNHLGPFLFTTLLVDRLLASAPARIVTVTSGNHFRPKAIDWKALRQPTRSLIGLDEYDVSKLANVLFTNELNARFGARSITAYAANPGAVASDMWRKIPRPVFAVYQAIRRMKPPSEGARSSVFCATEAEAGGYYDEDCTQKSPSAVATTQLARELWAASVNWSGQSADPCST